MHHLGLNVDDLLIVLPGMTIHLQHEASAHDFGQDHHDGIGDPSTLAQHSGNRRCTGRPAFRLRRRNMNDAVPQIDQVFSLIIIGVMIG